MNDEVIVSKGFQCGLYGAFVEYPGEPEAFVPLHALAALLKQLDGVAAHYRSKGERDNEDITLFLQAALLQVMLEAPVAAGKPS